MKIVVKADPLVNRGGNHPPFLLPVWFAGETNDVHHGSVAPRVVQQGPVDSNEHGVRNLLDAARHIGHRQKRTKRDLAGVIDDFISEDTGPYLGGAAVTAYQNIACVCLSASERHDDVFVILLQRLKTVIEKDAVGIVTKDGSGKCRMKIRAMHLMIRSAESLEVIWSRPPGFDHSACLEMAHEIPLCGSGFSRHPFANPQKVERVHRIRRDSHTCTDLSKLSRLLKHRNTIAEMLE